MANKYLDLAGLQRLANKIKELIPTRTSELDNDNGFITIEDIPDSTWENIQNKPDTFTPSEHNHTIGNITGLQNELNSKETPSGAQAKANQAEQNAKDYTDAGLADKVDKVSGKQLSTNDYTTIEKNKLAGIEENANNYIHPSTHPASIITESTSRRFVSDSEKATWNAKWDYNENTIKAVKVDNASNADTVNNKTVAENVPAGAKFTDTTYSEITTSEIDAGTSSTLRTISGRRIKYILDKVQGWINALTKADVGLGNVDNVKQMPISGGVLENYREKLVTLSGTSTTINLSLGNVFTHTLSGDTAYSISNAQSQAHSFTLIITQTETVRTITFPASVKWQGGEIPDLSGASKTYVLTFLSIDGGTTWFGMYGGEFGVS